MLVAAQPWRRTRVRAASSSARRTSTRGVVCGAPVDMIGNIPTGWSAVNKRECVLRHHHLRKTDASRIGYIRSLVAQVLKADYPVIGSLLHRPVGESHPVH